MKKPFILIAVFIFLYLNANSQDPSFSQIENTQFYAHPSFVNLNRGVEIEMAHRREWTKISPGFITSFMGINVQTGKKIGFGLTLLKDVEGIGLLTTQQAKIICRYKVFGDYYDTKGLSVALYGGYSQKSVDWSKLLFSDQIDPVFGIYRNTDQQIPANDKVIFFDAGASLTFKGLLKNGTLRFPSVFSISLHHLPGIINSDESLQQLNTTIKPYFAMTYSTTIQRNQLFGIPLLNPVIRYEWQSNVSKISIGTLIGILQQKSQSTLYTGLFYSSRFSSFQNHNTNSFVLTVGYEKYVNRSIYTLGYSYDINTSGLNHQSTGGVHEITLTLAFNLEVQGFRQPSNIFQKCPKGLSTF